MLLILYYKKKGGGNEGEREKKNQYLELKVKCEPYGEISGKKRRGTGVQVFPYCQPRNDMLSE